MTFDEVLAGVLDLLQRQGRVFYRALKRRFDLDDDYLEDLKVELLTAQQLARDETGEMLVWTGGPPSHTRHAGPGTPTAGLHTRIPRREDLTARHTLEGERKQVTGLFADLKVSTELIEGLDPEEARTLLDPALHPMMNAVHRYGGTVNQVLLGARHDCMRRYAEEVRRSHGLNTARVGLNSGAVVVRAMATTCIWTIPPSARPRIWQRAWSSSPPREVFG